MESPLQSLRNLFHALMGWEDEDLMPVDFVMSSYLTGFLPGSVEKAWGDLCGPPSIGKSEILRALDDGQQRTVMVDTLTENAFSSAMRDPEDPDKDFSLLYQLSDSRPPRGPKVLVIKEFSTLMNMRREKSDKIFADLRAAYDGSYATAAGNIGLDTKTDLNFGMLTACTEKLDEFRRTNQTLGERTLVCRIGRNTRSFKSRTAISNQVIREDRAKKFALRARIRGSVHKALNEAIVRIHRTRGRVGRSDALSARVAMLATIATSVRTTPLSERNYANMAEGPARFLLQLTAWGDCRVLFDARDKWDDDDYSLVRRIAQDTMPPESLRVIHTLYKFYGAIEGGCTLDEVYLDAQVESSFYRQLRQWAIIGIVDWDKDNLVRLHPDFADALTASRFTEGLI